MNFDYEIIYSRRKTLVVAVGLDKSVVVRAPQKTAIKTIQDYVEKVTPWIAKKLKQFEKYQAVSAKKQYIDGESHHYLGEEKKLVLQASARNSVVLHSDVLLVECKGEINPSQVRKNLERWFFGRAEGCFEKLYNECWQSCDYLAPKAPALKIRKMKARWGSYSPSKHLVTLNVELIKMPEKCLRYVIYHEFAHIKQANHGPKFYKLLAQLFPDWKDCQMRLRRVF